MTPCMLRALQQANLAGFENGTDQCDKLLDSELVATVQYTRGPLYLYPDPQMHVIPPMICRMYSYVKQKYLNSSIFLRHGSLNGCGNGFDIYLMFHS